MNSRTTDHDQYSSDDSTHSLPALSRDAGKLEATQLGDLSKPSPGNAVTSASDFELAAEDRRGRQSQDSPKLGTGLGGHLGTFKLIREIGRGGMGTVYEAFEDALQRRVALKVLPLAGLMDEQQIRRFQNEAAAAAQLSHPSIVPVYSVGVDRGVHFYAMKMIDGRDLSLVIRSTRQQMQERARGAGSNATPMAGGTTNEGVPARKSPSHRHDSKQTGSIGQDLTPEGYSAAIHSRKHHVAADRLFQAVARLGHDVANALHHAHEQGVIHRDIKPSNLLLDNQGQVWVTDFGLAQIQDNPGGTRTGDVVGTLRYMSPEQASGRRFLVDHRTDIYSLGISLYELLTLRHAFDGKGANEIIRQVSFTSPVAPRTLNPRIPAELEVIIQKSISKNPQDRYPSAAEMAEDLQRFLLGKPIVARRPSMARRVREWAQRHSTLAAVLAVFVLVTCVMSAGSSAVIYQFLKSETAQRKKAVSLLETSEGLRMLANSALVLPENPGLALSLAVAGARLHPGPEANTALQHALDENRERARISTGALLPWTVNLSPDSRRAVITAMPGAKTEANRHALLLELNSDDRTPRELPSTEPFTTLQMDQSITSAAFSPFGRFVLTASSETSLPWKSAADLATVRTDAAALWDASTGVQLLKFRQSRLAHAVSQCFSDDERTVLVPQDNNDVTAIDTATGQPRFILRGHNNPVVQAVFNPDSRLIATIDTAGMLRLWQGTDGTFIREISGLSPPQKADCLFFSEARQLIANVSAGVAIINADQPEEPAFLHASDMQPNASGRYLAGWFSGYDSVRIYDTVSGNVVSSIASDRTIQTVELNREGDRIAISNGNRAHVYDALNGQLLYQLAGHTDIVRDIQFSNDSQHLLTVSDDHTIRVWDSKSGLQQRMTDVASDLQSLTQPTISDDDQLILTPSVASGIVTVFDQTGVRIEGSATGGLASDNFNADRICVVDEMTVSVVDYSTSRTVAAKRFSGLQILSTLTIPGREQIVVIPSSGPTLLWTPSSNSTIELIAADQTVTDWCVAPDNNRGALTTASGLCVVFDTTTGQILRNIQHNTIAVDVAFWPQGSQLVTVTGDHVARIWADGDDVTPLTEFRASDVSFNQVYVTPDEASVVTVNEKGRGQAVCWNVSTGEIESRLDCPDHTSFDMHGSERKLLTASRTAGLHVWDLTGEPAMPISDRPCIKAMFVNDMIVATQFAAETNFSIADILIERGTLFADLVGFDVHTGTPQVNFGRWQAGALGVFSVDKVSGKIAVNQPQFSVAITSIADSTETALVADHREAISFASFLPRSHSFITCCWDGQAYHWDDNGRLLKAFKADCGSITTACLDQHGTRLTCGYRNGTVIDWDVKSGSELRRLDDSSDPVRCIQFDSRGNLLVLAGDSNVRYWNIQLNSVLQSTATLPVSGISLSLDGTRALVVQAPGSAATADRPVNGGNATAESQKGLAAAATSFLWNLDTNSTTAFQQTATCGQIGPHGSQLAIVTMDNRIQLVAIDQDGQLQSMQEIDPGTNAVQQVCFSPDGRLLATGTEITLWDTATGVQLQRCDVPETDNIRFGSPSNTAEWQPFSPSGQLIATSTGKTRWWHTDLLQAALAVPAQPLSQAEKQRFRLNDNLTDPGQN